MLTGIVDKSLWDLSEFNFLSQFGTSDGDFVFNFDDICVGFAVKVHFLNTGLSYIRDYDCHVTRVDVDRRIFRVTGFNCDFDKYGRMIDRDGCCIGIVAYHLGDFF